MVLVVETPAVEEEASIVIVEEEEVSAMPTNAVNAPVEILADSATAEVVEEVEETVVLAREASVTVAVVEEEEEEEVCAMPTRKESAPVEIPAVSATPKRRGMPCTLLHLHCLLLLPDRT